MHPSVLKTSHLTKRYKKQVAVHDISLHVGSGDIYGLVGQNGAGKTTLMRLVSALVTPDSGTIEILGETSPRGLAKARQKMGAIIETPALYGSLTARQNLEYYRKQRGITDRGNIDRALQIAGLTDTGRKKFKNFSLGMKQRLGLALAMISRPSFLMLDEPINGLDPTGIVEMRETLARMNAEGITILISSHILSELSLLVTRYGFIHRGQLIRELTREQLADECRHALHLETSDSTKAAGILASEQGIHEYQVLSPTQIRIYDQQADAAALIQTLVMAGIGVSEASKVGDSLETYYTRLVKEAEITC